LESNLFSLSDFLFSVYLRKFSSYILMLSVYTTVVARLNLICLNLPNYLSTACNRIRILSACAIDKCKHARQINLDTCLTGVMGLKTRSWHNFIKRALLQSHKCGHVTKFPVEQGAACDHVPFVWLRQSAPMFTNSD
jgi:hypothetical protein